MVAVASAAAAATAAATEADTHSHPPARLIVSQAGSFQQVEEPAQR